MQENKQLRPVFRYPFYLLAVCYYLTIHQILLVLVRLYSFIAQYFRSRKIRTLITQAAKTFNDGNYEKAIEHCLNCISKIPVVHRDYYWEYTQAVLYLSSLYRRVGKFNEAENYIQEANTLVKETDNDRIILYVYEGDLYADKGQFKKAEEKYLKALEAFSNSKETELYKNLCHNLYALYTELGQLELAAVYLDESNGNGSVDYENIIAEIELLKRKGEFSEAEIKANSLLAFLKQKSPQDAQTADVLKLLAELAYRQKCPDRALAFATKALSIYENLFEYEHPLIIACMSIIGSSQLKLKQYSSAKESLTRALQLANTVYGKISETYLTSLQNLAWLYSEIGEIIDSEKLFEESMEVYIILIKNHFADMSYNERMSLLSIYISHQQQIFNCISNNTNYSKEFINKVFDFRLNTKGQFWEKSFYSRTDTELFEKIRNSLDEDEVVIEAVRFLEAEEIETGIIKYIFFIISSSSKFAPKLITMLTNHKKEKKDYDFYIKNIKNKSVDFSSYDKFWNFLTPELKEKKTIYFSPSGIYQFINISTLITESGKHLCEEYSFYFYNDFRNFICRNEMGQNLPESALIMANPTFFNEEVYSKERTIEQFLPPLNSSYEEAVVVSTILETNKCKTKVYCKDSVTKTNFKDISKYQVLHIATHGYFGKFLNNIGNAEEMISRNGLFLSHPFTFSHAEQKLVLTKEGFLSNLEILEMDLQHVDLVTLSACNSGLGISVNTGDSFGFIKTFFSAGVNNIIISLWEIEDKVTTEFMESFYVNWMIERNKYSAFLKAQKEIKNRYRQPQYWGGFVLYHN